MMKLRKTISSLWLLTLGSGSLLAQESPTASGGEATGTGGTSSYSVGQVLNTTITGTNGSVSTGVQQPYEIFVFTGIKETKINLKMNVYPNPTVDFLSLEVENNENLSYQLYDLKGKLITSKKITDKKTTISMQNLSTATYVLRVVKDNKIIKSFKIIKN